MVVRSKPWSFIGREFDRDWYFCENKVFSDEEELLSNEIREFYGQCHYFDPVF